MKLYTKTGDSGLTSLYNGTRIKKTSYHFTCLGDFDTVTKFLKKKLIYISLV